MGREDRVAARSLADGSLVMAATDTLTIDGTIVPTATLARIDRSGSLVTIGAALPDVPLDFSLTTTGAGATVFEQVVTFSDALQILWTGDGAVSVGASATGHIAYVTRSGLDPEVVHLRTLDGSPLWTTTTAEDLYIDQPVIYVTANDEVSLIDSGARYVFDSSGFVERSNVPFREQRLQRDGSLVAFGSLHEGDVGPVDSRGMIRWTTNVRRVVTSAVVATNGDVLALRDPGNVVRLDSAGRELASHDNCGSDDAPYGLGLLYADETGYVLHDARGIARYEGP